MHPLEILGALALAWMVLALVAAAGWSLFTAGARQREELLPQDEAAVEAWVRGSAPRDGQTPLEAQRHRPAA